MQDDLDVVAVSGFATDASPGEGVASAASWPAIIAGAVAAAAVSLILLALGSGLGFASVSPWSAAPSPLTFTVLAGIWLIVTQWLASGIGGYLTGRLRTRWYGIHTHEVFFRDTAHGLVTWALATVLVVGLSGATALIAGDVGARSAAAAASTTARDPAAAPTPLHPLGYDVDFLFRPVRWDVPAVGPDTRAEAEKILGMGAANGGLPPADATYLTQLVSAHTGVSPPDALQRVQIVADREQAAVTRLKEDADNARKAAAAFAMITALSMLIGALIASVAAALGGQQRDEHL